MKVLVIGAGKMVSAILQGLRYEVNLSDWMIYSPSGTSAKKLSQEVGAKFTDSLDNLSVDYVLLGCKPQQLPEFASLHQNKISKFPIMSLLAAVPEKEQRSHLGAGRLIRVMPNMPVKFQKGVTLISSESSPEDLLPLQTLFKKLGKAYVMKEAELEELTLLSGSGPAFFYEFTKNMAESFTSLDLFQREEIARAVLLGSGTMASSESKDLETLISEVTSKGGVTIAVLEKFRSLDLKDLVRKGMDAGVKRTQEIKELLRRS
jgi:pyrroline-5-carboxylate reductase